MSAEVPYVPPGSAAYVGVTALTVANAKAAHYLENAMIHMLLLERAPAYALHCLDASTLARCERYDAEAPGAFKCRNAVAAADAWPQKEFVKNLLIYKLRATLSELKQEGTHAVLVLDARAPGLRRVAAKIEGRSHARQPPLPRLLPRPLPQLLLQLLPRLRMMARLVCVACSCLRSLLSDLFCVRALCWTELFRAQADAVVLRAGCFDEWLAHRHDFVVQMGGCPGCTGGACRRMGFAINAGVMLFRRTTTAFLEVSTAPPLGRALPLKSAPSEEPPLRRAPAIFLCGPLSPRRFVSKMRSIDLG